MEKASLDQELDLQESVLKAAHALELDTMDSTIRTLKSGLEILGLTTVDKKDEKATASSDTTGAFIQTEALQPPITPAKVSASLLQDVSIILTPTKPLASESQPGTSGGKPAFTSSAAEPVLNEGDKDDPDTTEILEDDDDAIVVEVSKLSPCQATKTSTLIPRKKTLHSHIADIRL